MTATCLSRPVPRFVTQVSAVSVVHVVVWQRISLTITVAVRSVVPKFKPDRERVVDPLVGAFVIAKNVVTLASYEKMPIAVPYAEEITMATPRAWPIAFGARHAM